MQRRGKRKDKGKTCVWADDGKGEDEACVGGRMEETRGKTNVEGLKRKERKKGCVGVMW